MEVEAIASLSNPITAIPLEHIRSDHEQKQPAKKVDVPAIDIGESVDDDALIIEQIARASEEWGLFQIVNHGIPTQVIALLQKAGKEFFELPQEEKEKIGKEQGSKSVEGYGTKLLNKDVEGKKLSCVDHLFHRVWPPTAVNYKFWPQSPEYYREANEEYCKHLRVVSEKLMKYLSLGLGLENHEMLDSFGGKELEYMMKINYYPPCSHPDVVYGITGHTDLSTLTISVPNDVPGLQVFRNGHWYEVDYIPNALIVHIGDQIEILSNGKYKAGQHRATMNRDKVRISWPVFLEPPPEKEIGPHPKLAGTENNSTDVEDEGRVDDDKDMIRENPGAVPVPPPKYKTMKFRDYQYWKLSKLPRL